MRMDHSEASTASDISEPQIKVNISQTDESKVAEQQSSSRLQQSRSSKPRVRCVADTGMYQGIWHFHDSLEYQLKYVVFFSFAARAYHDATVRSFGS